MKLQFIPLDLDYVDWDDSSVIRLFGRTLEGKRCCIIDRAPAYFWLLPKKGINLSKYADKVKEIKLAHAGREARVVNVKIKSKNFMGEPVKALQVFVNNPKDITVIKDIVKKFRETADKKEHDINFVSRYLIDKGVMPLALHHVEGKELSKEDLLLKDLELDVDLIIEASSIKIAPQEVEFKPRILAFDIEASEFEIGKGEILMISLADSRIRKTLTWKQFPSAPEHVEFVKDEAELIERFKEFVKEYKPDCLVGYFSDGFDLPYLRARADEHHIKLDLGIDGSQVTFIRGAIPSSEIRGLVHVDLYKFVNNIIAYTLRSESISLNDVAKELVGEEKLKIDLSKISKKLKETKGKLKEAELRRFVLYNLQDAILTAKLFEKLWPNISELTRIVSEPLFNASRATYSHLVEYNIIHNLHRFNEIAQSRPTHDEIGERRKRPRYIGAFVKEPTPALHENVGVFDFRSFWPNIIVSFNISLPTIREKKERGCYETPEFEFEGKKRKFYFVKEKGFIPKILGELLEKRKAIKQELKKKKTPILEARDYALKTLSNATYGYFGFFGARYYSLESAASTTAISRYYIHKTLNDIEKAGFKTIYADTDSCMFLLGNKTQHDALKVLKKINASLPGSMELELENFYRRGIFVTKRTGEIGAKKKYALVAPDGSIKIRGFETVRRDWCFPPNTNILVKDSVKYIKDIKNNEYVLTHEGKFRQVNTLYKRKYEGKLIEIFPYYSQKIEVTPEHPILAIKTKKCCYRPNTICKINCKRKDKWCKKYHQNYKKEWLKASELSSGDFLLCPIIKGENNIKFNIMDFLDSKKFFSEKKTIKNINESYSSIKIPAQKLSEKLVYLFGLYVAEGYATDTYHGYVRFTFSKKEKILVEKLVSFMKELFGVEASIIQRNSPERENVLEVIFYSKILGSLFKNLFGSKANEKKLPPWMLKLSKKYQIALVRGMFDGDGSYKNIRFRGIDYSTVSKNLAFQFRSILLRLSLIPSLKITKPKPSRIGKRDILSKNKRYSISIYGEQLKKANKIFDISYPWVKKRSKTYQHSHIDNSYAYIPIRKISKKDYKGFVYNIGVKDHNSYTVDNIAVHNCSLARDVQDTVLKKVLETGKIDAALKYVKEIIADIKAKKVPLDRLIIRTQLKKAIEEYAAIGPHVVIAQRMIKLGLPVKAGSLIEYIVAALRGKKVRIRDKARLPDEVRPGHYDVDYYLEHQIVPAIEGIFNIFRIEKDQLLESKKQTKLGNF